MTMTEHEGEYGARQDNAVVILSDSSCHLLAVNLRILFRKTKEQLIYKCVVDIYLLLNL